MQYIPVGKLNKSFGTKGQIKVVPEKAFKSDLLKSDVWFISRGSEIIPYFVDGIEEDVHLLVKFEDIDSPEDAKKITGSGLLLREKDVTIREEEPTDMDKMLGFDIFDDETYIGSIIRIEEYPQQLMAFVHVAQEEEVMIPLSSTFIKGMDPSEKILVMNLPHGLIESQLS